MKIQKEVDDPIDLLRSLYPCISSAISYELEHGNYSEIERLKDLRQRAERVLFQSHAD